MITRVYCPLCDTLSFLLIGKYSKIWYGHCENCGAYVEGVENPIKDSFQVEYNKIHKMEDIYR